MILDIFDDRFEDYRLANSGNGWRLIQFEGIADPSSWPKAASSKICLFEATALVGRCMFGMEWTGEELLVDIGWADPGFVPLSIDQVRRFEMNNAALRRLDKVVEWIAQRCRDGEVTCFYRRRSGGALVQMSAHEWNIERPLSNFWLFGGHDLRAPGNALRFSEQVYIFLEKADVLRAIATLDTRSVPYEAVIEWCRQWMGSGQGNGMDRAWIAFHADPAHRDLSRDHVFRPAWREAKA